MPRGIYKHKINQGFRKGNKLGNKFVKGHVMTELVKKKISESCTGKKHTKETKRKISESGKKSINSGRIKLGQRLSEETKRKMSLSQRGKRVSKKTRRILSNQRMGIRGSNWKGGITLLNKIIRNSFEYRQWRSDIFTRDNFTCFICGIRGVDLNADHHPKMFYEIIKEYNVKSFEDALRCEELWNINNGRTLCLDCHKKYGRRKKYKSDSRIGT